MAYKRKLQQEIRTQLVDEYRPSDCEIHETTSWPDGLNESSRFLPYLPRPVRRTDSVDDIERYKLYFSIARKNQRNQLTWNEYCDILLDDLQNSDIIGALNKLSIQSSSTPVKSDVPSFSIALRSTSPIGNRTLENKRSFLNIDGIPSVNDVKPGSPSDDAVKLPPQFVNAPVKSEVPDFPQYATSENSENFFANYPSKKRSFLDTDVESVSSLEDVKFHTPSKNVLKRMCTEIRTLAQRTCRTVEKIAMAPKYCVVCGDVIRSTTVHKKCSKQLINRTCSNTTSGLSKSAETSKNWPITFQSPTITPSNVILEDSRSKRLRRRPLFKF